MSNNIKLSNGARILITYIGIKKFKSFFLDIFFVAYFYKISDKNMMYLSLYNIFVFVIGTIAAILLGNVIKTKYKLPIFRIGTVLYCLYLFLIVYLKENILNHIYLIGFISGLGNCMCGFTFNMIKSEQVNNIERSKFEGYQAALNQTISLIAPILLGAYISIKSYEITAILVLIFCLMELIISFFMKDKNMRHNKLDLKRFSQIIKKDNNKSMNKIYLIEFLRGITISGVLSLIVILLIVYEFKNDFNLGIITSILSLFTIITMMWFSKYYDKNNSKLILKLCSFAIVLGFLPLIFFINIITVVIYNIVHCIFIRLLDSITQVRLFDYSNKEEFKDDLNTEYFMFREFYLNGGRIIGYIILLLIGLVNNLEYLKVFLLFITIILVSIAFISNQLSKREKNNQMNDE